MESKLGANSRCQISEWLIKHMSKSRMATAVGESLIKKLNDNVSKVGFGLVG